MKCCIGAEPYTYFTPVTLRHRPFFFIIPSCLNLFTLALFPIPLCLFFIRPFLFSHPALLIFAV